MNSRSLAQKIVEAALRSDKRFVAALRKGSVSDQVAQARLKEYTKALSNAIGYMQGAKMFSVGGTTNFPNLGAVVGLSSLLAMVTSFAGFLSIERTIEQPRAFQYFLDIIGTNFGASGQPDALFPVVGPTRYSDESIAWHRATYTESLSSPYTLTVGNGVGGGLVTFSYPIIPGTLKITLTLNWTITDPSTGATTNSVSTYVITDDRQGNLLIPSSLIGQVSSAVTPRINYGTYGPPSGMTPAMLGLAFNFTAPPNASALNVKVLVEANRAYIEEPTFPQSGNDTRFALNMSRTIGIDTKPSLLTVTFNLNELAAIQKSLNFDAQSYLTNKITEIYTKLVNKYIVETFIRHFGATPEVTVDVTAPNVTATSSFDQYIPILSKLVGEMESVSHRLAMKSFIGLKPTAYLVSPRLAYYMKRTRLLDTGAFVDEQQNYINDLAGYWYGTPVLVHTALSQFDTSYTITPSGGGSPVTFYRAFGYAVHLRPDASLGPTFYATFLPPTYTPTIGNFNNPVQQAMSLYYQADCVPLAPELVVPFEVLGLPGS